jgi:hypothetical protein
LLALAGCGGNSPGANPGKIVAATTEPGRVTVKVTGAVSFDFSGTTPLQIVVTDTSKLNPQLRFESVALQQPAAAGRWKFQTGFNLTGTVGTGKFQIQPRPASPSPGVIPSTAYLDISAPTAMRFDEPTTPCTVTVGKNARTGSLVCPSVTDSTGKKTVSFTMTWSAA